MVEATKVSSINIDTGYAGVKEYPFFTRVNKDGLIIDDAQVSIVLGGNGSGKSTIARALNGNNKDVKFFDKDGNLLGGDCLNVHVFDEAYVTKNFRASPENSLDSVVMLGDSVELGDNIKELKNNISSISANIEFLKNRYLRDVLPGESANVHIPHLGFTLTDYVKALIENEFLIEEELLFHEDESGEWPRIDLYDSIFFTMQDGKFTSKEEYVRCIANGFQRRYIDICNEIAENAPSDYSVTFIENEIYKAIGSLEENWESIDRSLEGDVSIEVYQGIDSSWRKLSYWIMFLIFKKYNSVFQKISSRIISSGDKELFKEYKREIVRLEEDLSVLEGELEEMNRKNSTRPVVNYINRLLGMVFDKEVIRIKPAMNYGYHVKNGQELVKPSRLSVGEQNILSLCYFFATLAQGKSFTTHIQSGNLEFSLMENQIIVLDDPLSSFDDGNKYGVMSLLGYLCQSILDGASKTKLIIMTHDSSFALNMSKMVKAIDDSKLSCWDLQKDSSDVFIKSKFEDVDRYADMLRIMYDFAVPTQKNAVVPTPNDVRRVWEAFLSFELGMTSIAEMGAMKNLSASFAKDQRIERFVRIFIPQLFINSDSHSKSQVINGNLYLRPTLVGKPYEDFVKNILSFMHIIAPRHVVWRMKKYKGEEKKILDFVDELDNLLKDVLSKFNRATALESIGGNSEVASCAPLSSTCTPGDSPSGY